MNKHCKALLLVTFLAFGLGCGNSTKMPTIMQLNPATIAHGDAQFQLEVDGTNFASNAMVNFNGTAVATTFVSSTKLEAMIPAAAIMNPGTVPVTVTNPGSGGIYGSGSRTSAPMNFTIS